MFSLCWRHHAHALFIHAIGWKGNKCATKWILFFDAAHLVVSHCTALNRRHDFHSPDIRRPQLDLKVRSKISNCSRCTLFEKAVSIIRLISVEFQSETTCKMKISVATWNHSIKPIHCRGTLLLYWKRKLVVRNDRTSRPVAVNKRHNPEKKNRHTKSEEMRSSLH